MSIVAARAGHVSVRRPTVQGDIAKVMRNRCEAGRAVNHPLGA